MKSIRRGVFETNSSSTHSITICSKEEYEKWEKGEVLLNEGFRAKEKFITKEDAINKLKNDGYHECLDFENEEEVNDALRDEDIKTCDEYFSCDYETFEETFTTKNGDEMVVFGYYGYNG